VIAYDSFTLALENTFLLLRILLEDRGAEEVKAKGCEVSESKKR
jgi:hypothetical protein